MFMVQESVTTFLEAEYPTDIFNSVQGSPDYDFSFVQENSATEMSL